MKIQFIQSDQRNNNVIINSVNEVGFLTGGKDRKIVFMDNEGNPLQVLFI